MKTIIIRYDWWGGHFKDKKWWTGLFEGTEEVFDYHTKDELKRLAEREGFNWKVIRQHRDGTVSIVEKSVQKCNINRMCEYCKLQTFENKYVRAKWRCEKFGLYLDQNENTLEIYSCDECTRNEERGVV